MVCNYLIKFGCSRKYIFLVCHMIEKDQVTEVSSIILPILVAISTVLIEI